MISVLFFLAMLMVDTVLMTLFRIDPSAVNLSFVPAASLVYISFRMVDESFPKAIFWAFFVGLLYDLMLYNALFDYAFSMVLVMLIMRIWTKHVSESIIERIMLGMLLIFVKEAALYGLALIQGFSIIHLSVWLTSRVFLTILGNIPVILLVIGWIDIQESFDASQKRKQRKKERVSWYRFK